MSGRNWKYFFFQEIVYRKKFINWISNCCFVCLVFIFLQFVSCNDFPFVFWLNRSGLCSVDKPCAQFKDYKSSSISPRYKNCLYFAWSYLFDYTFFSTSFNFSQNKLIGFRSLKLIFPTKISQMFNTFSLIFIVCFTQVNAGSSNKDLLIYLSLFFNWITKIIINHINFNSFRWSNRFVWILFLNVCAHGSTTIRLVVPFVLIQIIVIIIRLFWMFNSILFVCLCRTYAHTIDRSAGSGCLLTVSLSLFRSLTKLQWLIFLVTGVGPGCLALFVFKAMKKNKVWRNSCVLTDARFKILLLIWFWSQ